MNSIIFSVIVIICRIVFFVLCIFILFYLIRYFLSYYFQYSSSHIDKVLRNENIDENDKIDQKEFASCNEVFHIYPNIFTYDEAKSVCSYYNAKLATYENIKEAYENGADWCNYGWSENELTLYPNQVNSKKCGNRGIQGGNFYNTKLQFGVNCYGKKPNKKIETINTTCNNQSKEQQVKLEQERKKKVIEKINSNENILPFNNHLWSFNITTNKCA